MDLLTRTKQLAESVDFDRTAVCAELGVTTRWLQMVISGEIADPGVSKVERLHDLLKRTAKKGKAA